MNRGYLYKTDKTNLCSYKSREWFLLQVDEEPERETKKRLGVLVTLCLLIRVHVFSDLGKIHPTGYLRFLHFSEHRLSFPKQECVLYFVFKTG